jgi:hypothetical protein
MCEFWKKLFIFLGLSLPPEETAPQAESLVPAMPVAGWTVTWETVLPGMRGLVRLPVGSGAAMTVHFDTVTLADLLAKIGQIAEVTAGRAASPDPDFMPTGLIWLVGPGWDIQANFLAQAERVEFVLGKWGARESVSGQADIDVLLWALILCPDYHAVAECLKRNAHGWQGYSV